MTKNRKENLEFEDYILKIKVTTKKKEKFFFETTIYMRLKEVFCSFLSKLLIRQLFFHLFPFFEIFFIFFFYFFG